MPVSRSCQSGEATIFDASSQSAINDLVRIGTVQVLEEEITREDNTITENNQTGKISHLSTDLSYIPLARRRLDDYLIPKCGKHHKRLKG
eukprot:TRINITY_DN182349_c0_g1_i1.p1 TRINITY_DN182349_c0_g1~~TRINITY_DN182349_c0_g1_i1.p1  ORF type:complete len:100 (+),score=6.39 TRINITY_DN182349_c0_g1_i1:33-302(+)